MPVGAAVARQALRNLDGHELGTTTRGSGMPSSRSVGAVVMAKTHVRGGMVLWLWTTALVPVPLLGVVAGLPIAAGWALGPDIDSDGSRFTRSGGPWTWKLSKWTRRRFDGHRGGMHSLLVGAPLCASVSLLAAILVVVPALVLGGQSAGSVASAVGTFGLAGYVGAASHSMLDFFTCQCPWCKQEPRREELPAVRHRNRVGERMPGVCLLWPLYRKRLGIAVLAVDSEAEHEVVYDRWLPWLGYVGAGLTVARFMLEARN